MNSPSQGTQESLVAEDAIPLGFRFGAVRAGIKASGNPDFSCALADSDATAAAMFTSNKIVAAPLTVAQRSLKLSQHRVRAFIVNSGNANCATGEAGIQAAQHLCEKAHDTFSCDTAKVFSSSTGIIGVPLPVEKLVAALPALRDSLGSSAAHFEAMARAIMTTDTRPKVAVASFQSGGRTVRLAGVAKGAGMIQPRLVSSGVQAPHATMLAYIFTDAVLQPEEAAAMLRDAVEPTFNRISIDSDTSTNDTVLLLASGAAGVLVEASANDRNGQGEGDVSPAFTAALRSICLSLARQIVADGEGADHVVELNIRGALSDSDALQVARAIAHSPLVKTSWAGRDPNWGRILAAVGNAGVPINPALVSIHLGEMEICRNGSVSPDFDKAAGHRYLEQRNLTIDVDLGLGQGNCRFWTTDLTVEYVHINADYTT
jgi:glutamate N-acetyltransferase/amino-acid N-acetyltransferase